MITVRQKTRYKKTRNKRRSKIKIKHWIIRGAVLCRRPEGHGDNHGNHGDNQGNHGDNNRYITSTILIFSSVYVHCTIPQYYNRE